MKGWKAAIIGAALILTAPVSSPMSAQDAPKSGPSREELQRLYTEYLKEEGYRPQIDEDGDVRFKREGLLYFIPVSEKDPEFFTVVLANIWKIETEEERIRVLKAADASNAKSKVAKVYTVKDNVWASVEVFVRKPEDFKGIFERSMEALSDGMRCFLSRMKGDL